MNAMHKLFCPKSVAVIGASDRPKSVGRMVFQNLMNQDFTGEVYPVNPKHATLDGQVCYGIVGDLPRPADLAVLCTPAATVPELVRQCGQVGTLSIIILSAGFREIGETGGELEANVRSVQRQFPGMRIVGPNCLGLMSPHHGLNASFASDQAPRGSVAFISQSGALCTSVLDWALGEHVGFSHFVSVGNMLDVSVADLIDYFATDNLTESIIMYIESITDARHFMSAARAFAKNKPIIAYKAGRFVESAQAAASHTGAMAGVDAVYEAALARAGIVRVSEVDDLFDCAELLSRRKRLQGMRLAIVTNAGGPGVMATDCLLEHHGKLAALSANTIAKLNEHLPAAWSHGNPVDVLGDATAERFGVAADLVLADPAVDGLLVILTPQAMTD
ncbi:MAG: CoA-binding protein, partial [Aureliella sp.]